MKPLNCSIGDLAITVNCSNPKNLGNIVRVISGIGYEEWANHDELVYTWNVEIATEHGLLHYQYQDGEYYSFKAGPVPDSYLRRLTPPKDYLMDEALDSEEMDLHFHKKDLNEA